MYSIRTAPLALALCLASAPVLAQSTPAHDPTVDHSIEEEHRRAMALRSHHQDEAARAIFARLWERTHEPRARARQALAEHALGRHADAEAHLSEALAAQNDPWIAQNRTLLDPVLQQARAAQGISLLLVRCAQPGASVFINGASAGPAGTSIRVAPGRMTFELRATGFVTIARTVTIAPGATATEEIELATAASPRPTAVATESVMTAGEQRLAESRLAAARATARTYRTLAWTSAGVGGALLMTGAVAWAVGGGAATRFNSDACLSATQTRAQNCPADLATAESMRALSAATLVGAGVLGATAAALFIVPRSPEQVRRGAALGCAPGLSSDRVALFCAGVF
ncbi:MAG: PEGA domain-containing protein [Myxococcales bacterium]|nr:PEGA domain-containing protein [Myxococcales bacterium]